MSNDYFLTKLNMTYLHHDGAETTRQVASFKKNISYDIYNCQGNS